MRRWCLRHPNLVVVALILVWAWFLYVGAYTLAHRRWGYVPGAAVVLVATEGPLCEFCAAYYDIEVAQ